MTAVILAGGVGTRLQSLISDVPKPMASIDNKPFLQYLMEFLVSRGIKKIILAVGYKSKTIVDYFGESFENIPVFYTFEKKPLGTGGAVKSVIDKFSDENFLILNGDTYFGIDLQSLLRVHTDNNADITISLRLMEKCDSDRYGIIELYQERVISMIPKKFAINSYINGGIYFIRKGIFDSFNLSDNFSFEKFISESLNSLKICGVPFDSHFIDIGIPEDYIEAQRKIPIWVKK